MKLDFRRAKSRSKQKFSQLASSARRSSEHQTPRSSHDVSETAGTSTETSGVAVPSESSTSAVSESSEHKHTLLNAAALSRNAQSHSISALTRSADFAIVIAAREATTKTTDKPRPEGGRLWEAAFAELDEDKRLILQNKFPQSKSWQIVDEVISKTTETYEEEEKKRMLLKIPGGGDNRPIVLRDKALSLLKQHYLTRLYIAARFGSEKIVQKFLSELNSPSEVQDLETWDDSRYYLPRRPGNSLLAAFGYGRSNVIALLLKHGFRLSQPEFESIFKLGDRKEIKSLRSSLQAIIGTPTRISSKTAQNHEPTKIQITTEVLRNVLDSEGSHECCRSILETLLEFWPPELQITDALSKVIIPNERRPGVMDLLLDQVGDISTEDGLVALVASFVDNPILLRRLFARFGSNVPITERVMLQVASQADTGYADEVLQILLDQKGPDNPVTEKVVETAAANRERPKAVLEFLFDRNGSNIPVTEQVMKAAAANWGSGHSAIEVLFNRNGSDIPVTEEVMKAAAANWGRGKSAMEVLFNRKGSDIPVTEEVLKAAAGNFGWCKEILELLFDRKGSDIPVTEEVVKAAAGNARRGSDALCALLDHKGFNTPITEEVIKALAENLEEGSIGLVVLFRHKELDIPVTEGVIKAAAKAGNDRFIDELLDRGILPGVTEKWKTISRLYRAIYDQRIECEVEEIRSWIFESDVLDTMKKENLTPLHEAIVQGNGDLLQIMLDTGAMDLDQRDERGRTPLEYGRHYVIGDMRGEGELRLLEIACEKQKRQKMREAEGDGP